MDSAAGLCTRLMDCADDIEWPEHGRQPEITKVVTDYARAFPNSTVLDYLIVNRWNARNTKRDQAWFDRWLDEHWAWCIDSGNMAALAEADLAYLLIKLTYRQIAPVSHHCGMIRMQYRRRRKMFMPASGNCRPTQYRPVVTTHDL